MLKLVIVSFVSFKIIHCFVDWVTISKCRCHYHSKKDNFHEISVRNDQTTRQHEHANTDRGVARVAVDTCAAACVDVFLSAALCCYSVLCVVVIVREGDRVIRDGDDCSCVFFVASGEVLLRQRLRPDVIARGEHAANADDLSFSWAYGEAYVQSVELSRLGVGGFFGEDGVLDNSEYRQVTVIANEQCLTYAIDRSTFHKFIRGQMANILQDMAEKKKDMRSKRIHKVSAAAYNKRTNRNGCNRTQAHDQLLTMVY